MCLIFNFEGAQMEENFNKHLGSKLKTRRLTLGLTQTKVAKAINVTFQQIQKYEKGINGVGSIRLLQLSNYLKVPINYFFDDYVEYSNNPNRTADQQSDQWGEGFTADFRIDLPRSVANNRKIRKIHKKRKNTILYCMRKYWEINLCLVALYALERTCSYRREGNILSRIFFKFFCYPIVRIVIYKGLIFR